MSRELSVKVFSYISYFLFSHDSCDQGVILDNDMDEDKVGLKVEDWKETKEEYDKDLEVLDEDVNGTNDNKEEDRPKKTEHSIQTDRKSV